ncbi:9458_t:CDS:10 [Diversispora eburnea]|uniref:9458_t:CDS:1 n=1 Tax=Diversispora eburnea TaxID=1213867 RepID=A0A9N9CWZ8_9GLOM|nr:9458_t:CDS:10 [Diversispora eburnea]
MAGFFAETPLESWSLDSLSEWCALNVTCDKKKLLDYMKKAIQEMSNNPVSENAKLKADFMYTKLEASISFHLSWKLAKNKSDYFKFLQDLWKIKDEETFRLAQIKSYETIQLAEIKSKNLQEHTSTVVDFHRNIAIDLTTINNRKRKEIPAYEDEELTPSEDDNKVSKITKIDHHFVHAVTPSPLDKNEHDTDFEAEQDPSLNLAIGRLAEIKSGIGRYRIIFLPEDNVHNPIKRLFNDEEWSIMESNWEKIDENVKLLLEKYDKCIKDATIKCYVDLNKVESIICKSPFEDQHLYLFERDYHLRWVQSVYNAFILCLQTPFSPLGDPDTSEYAYRSRVINYIWEGLFFDVNAIAIMKTGEVENVDRKKQLDLSRNLDQRKSSLGTWYHDAVLVMKVGSKLVQIVFGEVIGNAFKRDDKKYNDDKEKMIKAMQLALFNLRKSLPEKAPGLEDLETFGLLVYRKEFLLYSMHWVDGIYLVDQFNGFTIPDTSLDLENLSNIIQIMIKFKVISPTIDDDAEGIDQSSVCEAGYSVSNTISTKMKNSNDTPAFNISDNTSNSDVAPERIENSSNITSDSYIFQEKDSRPSTPLIPIENGNTSEEKAIDEFLDSKHRETVSKEIIQSIKEKKLRDQEKIITSRVL